MPKLLIFFSDLHFSHKELEFGFFLQKGQIRLVRLLNEWDKLCGEANIHVAAELPK